MQYLTEMSWSLKIFVKTVSSAIHKTLYWVLITTNGIPNWLTILAVILTFFCKTWCSLSKRSWKFGIHFFVFHRTILWTGKKPFYCSFNILSWALLLFNLFVTCFHEFRIYELFFTKIFLFSFKTGYNSSIEIKRCIYNYLFSQKEKNKNFFCEKKNCRFGIREIMYRTGFSWKYCVQFFNQFCLTLLN